MFPLELGLLKLFNRILVNVEIDVWFILKGDNYKNIVSVWGVGVDLLFCEEEVTPL